MLLIGMPWYYNPHTGGHKISPSDQEKALSDAKAFEEKASWYPKYHLQLRFKGQFCYIDAIEGSDSPMPLCRLRYLQDQKWSMAYFTYSNDKYTPCMINGNHTGTLAAAIAVCEGYLLD